MVSVENQFFGIKTVTNLHFKSCSKLLEMPMSAGMSFFFRQFITVVLEKFSFFMVL